MKRGAIAGGLLAIALLMQACVIAPGMKMTEPAELPGGQVVRVQSLTLALLNQMEEDRKLAARELVREFSSTRKRYRIGPGDILQVIVWDHPELTIPTG